MSGGYSPTPKSNAASPMPFGAGQGFSSQSSTKASSSSSPSVMDRLKNAASKPADYAGDAVKSTGSALKSAAAAGAGAVAVMTPAVSVYDSMTGGKIAKSAAKNAVDAGKEYVKAQNSAVMAAASATPVGAAYNYVKTPSNSQEQANTKKPIPTWNKADIDKMNNAAASFGTQGSGNNGSKSGGSSGGQNGVRDSGGNNNQQSANRQNSQNDQASRQNNNVGGNDNVSDQSPFAGSLSAQESTMNPRAALAKRMVDQQGYSYSEANAAVNMMSDQRVSELLGGGTNQQDGISSEYDKLKNDLMAAVGIDEKEMKYAQAYLQKIGKLKGVEASLDAWASGLTGNDLLKAAAENGVTVSDSLKAELAKAGNSPAPDFVISKDKRSAVTPMGMVVGEDGLPSYEYRYGTVNKEGKVTGATTVRVDAFNTADGTYIQHHDGVVVRGDVAKEVESKDANKGAAGAGVDFTGVTESIKAPTFQAYKGTTWVSNANGLTSEQAAQRNASERAAEVASANSQVQQVKQFFGGLDKAAVGDDRGNIANRLDAGDYVNQNGGNYSAGNYAEQILADKAAVANLTPAAVAEVKKYEVTRPIWDDKGNITGYAKNSDIGQAQSFQAYTAEESARWTASGLGDNLSENDRKEFFPSATTHAETGGSYVSGNRAKVIGSLNASQMTAENLALLEEIDNEMSGNRAAHIGMDNGSVQGSGVYGGSAADAERIAIGNLPGGYSTSTSPTDPSNALASQPAASNVAERRASGMTSGI